MTGYPAEILLNNLPDEESESKYITRSEPDVAFICRGKSPKVRQTKLGLSASLAPSVARPQKRIRTGGTRLLRGCGGKIGITIRRITNAEHMNEMNARARVGMRGNILKR
jgi:hypothetical protein